MFEKNTSSVGSTKRLEILFVSAHLPNMNGIGSEKRAWAHLLALACLGNVHLVVLSNGKNSHQNDLGAVSEFVDSAQVVEFIHHNLDLSMIPGMTYIKEYCFAKRKQIHLDSLSEIKLSEIFKKYNFDLIFCFRWQSAWLIRDYLALPAPYFKTVVDLDDIDSKAMERRLAIDGETLGKEIKEIHKLWIKRQRKIEKVLSTKVNLLIVCSENDSYELQNRFNKPSVFALPNCIDVPMQHKINSIDNRDVVTILFVGTMSYSPNEDAVAYFCEEILPSLIDEIKDIALVFKIVGFSPSQRVLDLHNGKTVIVTGGVESISEYYRDADIVVCPIRHGGGTRIKILEAMGYGLPIVSTVIGAEGIEVEHTKNIILCATTDEFKQSCLDLIANREYQRFLGSNGRDLVIEKYSSDIIKEKLIKKMQDIVLKTANIIN